MSYGQSRNYELPPPEVITGAVVAALVASCSLAGLLAWTGTLESVPGLYGLNGHGWTIAIGHGLVAAVPFVAVLTRVASHRFAPAPLAGALSSPFLGACFGVIYGTGCWLVGVAYGVPIWVGFTGGSLPVPYHHIPSLVALLGYGVILGSWYPLVRTAVVARDRRRRTRP